MKNALIVRLINYSLILTMLVWLAPHPTLAAVTPVNLLSDPSFEDPACASPAPNLIPCWQGSNGSIFNYTSTAHTGNSSIELTSQDSSGTVAVYQRIDLNQIELKPVFIGGYVKGNNIFKSGWFGASMYAEIHLNNNQTIYQYSVPNSGTFDWRWIGFNTGTNTSIDSPIGYIEVIVILQQASGTAYFDDITASEFTPAQGAVTFMFDDGETGTYTEAKKIMDRYGFVGSSAVISDQTDEAGFMNPTQIAALQAGGWEIVSHSKNHEDMTAMAAANYNVEFTASKTALEGIIGAGKVTDFAYPLGAYNAELLAAAVTNGYQSARAYELGDNPIGLYPFDVKVRSVVEATTLAEVQGWLDEAKARNRWEVIVMHTVTERGDDTYHVSPAFLNHLMELVKNSALSVVTYDQGIQNFAVAK